MDRQPVRVTFGCNGGARVTDSRERRGTKDEVGGSPGASAASQSTLRLPRGFVASLLYFATVNAPGSTSVEVSGLVTRTSQTRTLGPFLLTEISAAISVGDTVRIVTAGAGPLPFSNVMLARDRASPTETVWTCH